MSGGILVAGCGSIGRRHARNLARLGAAPLLVFDPDHERAAEASRFGAVACASLEAGLARQPAAVIICTPPHLHTAGARLALETGAHVFVEKPIAVTLHGIDDLLALAARHQRIVAVGYNLRFHAGLVALKSLLDAGAIGRLVMLRAEFGQYLPDWRPEQDYRSGYMARSAWGGGIVLDASHEIDYVRWLAGEVVSVFALVAKVSDLELEAEDTALLTLRFASGVVGQVHLDCVQRGYARGCKLVGTEGTLVWEFTDGVRVYSDSGKIRETQPIVPDTNDMYLAEMEHFLSCVHGKAQPLVSGADGKRVLEIALAARRAGVEQREVAV